jgi:peptidoglycan hydrolase-like protein with peptidoglycan-binding domain
MTDKRYYSIRDNKANIYELQSFLRFIATNSEGIPLIVPDGIYGPETRMAVMAFQKKSGLPQTGEVDLLTWEEIVAVYDNLKRQNKTPNRIAGYPLDIPSLKEGDDFEEIYLLQIMLRKIARVFKNITMPDLTGVYDSKTSRAVEDFSRLYGKESHGKVDRELWNILTNTHNAIVLNN